MAKTSPFSMRLDPDLKAGLQRLADEDRRTLTNYLECLLRDHLEEKLRGKGKRAGRVQGNDSAAS